MNDVLKKYVVSMASDIPKAEAAGFSCVHLAYKISPGGVLQRAQSGYSIPRKNIMGIFDGSGLADVSPEKLSRDIATEMTRRGYAGVLLDIKGDSSNITAIEQLCSILAQKKITHFLPAELASLSPAAKIIVPASVSGGSIGEMVSSLCMRFPPQRICLEIVRGCSDFTMPSYNSEGTELSAENFGKLLENYAPTAYFSDALGCKYFTYRKEAETHFVLFDDADTAVYKVRLAANANLYGVFILYSEWGGLCKNILSSQ